MESGEPYAILSQGNYRGNYSVNDHECISPDNNSIKSSVNHFSMDELF